MEEEIFNPAEASKNIKEDFVDYILSTRYCYSEEIRAKLKKELLATIAKGPFVSITDLFKEGATLKDLEKEAKPADRLSSEFEKLEQGKEKETAIRSPFVSPSGKGISKSLRRPEHRRDNRNRIRKD